MAINEQTQKDTAKAESRTFGRNKQTQRDTAKAESRTFGRSKRAQEEEEEELLAQEEILKNNPMMQPVNLMGQQAPVEQLYPEQGMQFGGTGNSLFGTQPTDGGVDPTVLAGLGLGGGIVAAGTGGQAATSQVLSPFAQRVAAQDAARLAAQNRPALIGGPTTTQGVLTGPNTPAQYTGTAQGRPVPGTQLAPQGQPPAVRGTGGAPAVRGTSGAPMKIAQKVGTAAKASRFASPGSIAYTAADLGTAALTGKGITQRIVEPIAGSLAELYYGDGNLPAFSPEELAQIQQGPVAQDPGLPQMSRLGDEPLTFTAPTGLSSAPQRAAELAATLPDDSGLMGAPGVQGTGISTLR